MTRQGLLLLSSVLSLSACDASSTSKSGADAGPGLDGGDTGGQNGTDEDAGSIAQDAGSTGDDASSATDSGVPVDPTLWEGCPGADAYTGPTEGKHPVTATGSAIYCALFDESRTLKEELRAKAMLRVAEGAYSLNAEAAQSYRLPLCIRTRESPEPVLGEAGSVTYETSTYDNLTYHNYVYSQAWTLGNVTQNLTARLQLIATEAKPASLTLDGSERPLFEQDASRFDVELCQGMSECWPVLQFRSCDFDAARLNLHEVELDDGNVTLSLRIGESFASTEPGAFVRAQGTFRGVAFDQTDYWKLIYNPDHHHFARDFAVLFDEPIDGVCGLEVSRLEPFEPDSEPDEAYAIDCDLERIDTLKVESHKLSFPEE